VALRAGAESGVEAEAARLQLGHVESAVGAGHGGGEQLLFSAGNGDQHEAIGQLQRLGDGGLEALLHGGLAGGQRRRVGQRLLEQDAVNDRFDGVVLAAVQRNRLGEVHQFAIDAGAKALPVKLVEQFLELALAPADDGRHHGDALAHAEFENALDDLVGALAEMGLPQLGQWGVPTEA
jgi:hypothetical protein